MSASPAGYRIEPRPPTVAELRRLYDSTGWDDVPDDDDALERGLAASLFAVVATHDGKVVGCARVVGDDAVYYYVQDVIVLPVHQGHGVGALLMDEVIRYLEREAPDRAFIGLFASEGKVGFYERYGFDARVGDAPGMGREWHPGG